MQHTFSCPHCKAPVDFEDHEHRVAVKCAYCGMSAPIPEALRPKSPKRSRFGDDAMRQVSTLLLSGDLTQAAKVISKRTGMSAQAANEFVAALRSGDTETVTRYIGQLDGARVTVHAVSFDAESRKQARRVARAAGGVSLIGCLFPVAIIIAVNVAVLSYFDQLKEIVPGLQRMANQFSSTVSSYRGLSFSGAASLTGLGEQANLIAVAMDNSGGKSEPVLAFVDVASNTVRWRAPSELNEKFVAAGDLLLQTDKARLRALSLTDGAVRWETSLSDGVSPACKTCIAASPAHVFVISSDNRLQAFERASGRKIADRKITSGVDRITLLDSDGGLVLIDQDEDGAPVVRVLNPDLTPRSEFAAACDADGWTQPEGAGDLTHTIDMAARTITLLRQREGDQICVTRRALDTGAVQWEALPAGIRFGIFDAQLQTRAGAVYLLTGQTVLALAEKTGEQLGRFDAEEGFEFLRIRGARDGVLLLSAQRTLGSRRLELWALDLAAGKQLWTVRFEPQDSDMTDGEIVGLMAKDDDEIAWSAHVDARGVRLLRVHAKPEFAYSIETLGLRDGVSQGKQTRAFVSNSILLKPRIFAWNDEDVWFFGGGEILRVDVTTGETTFRTP
jgi:outer membrane protein assembly factor BamB